MRARYKLVPAAVARCLNTLGAFELAPEVLPDSMPGCAMMIGFDEWLRLLRRQSQVALAQVYGGCDEAVEYVAAGAP